MKVKGWIFIVIIVLVQTSFVVYQASAENYYLPDSERYINYSENLVERIFSSGNEQGPETSVGYPIFLSLVRLVSGNPIFIAILQSLLSVLSIWIMLRIYPPGRGTFVPLLLFTLLLPYQYIYSNLVMPEILFQLIIILAFFCLNNFLIGKHRRNLWLYQALLIIGILIKPVLAIFLIPNIIFFIGRYFRKKNRLTYLSSLIPIIFIVIFAGMKQNKTGYFHVSNEYDNNLLHHNLYFFALSQEGPEKAFELRKEIKQYCAQTENEKEASQCLRTQVITYISQHKKEYLIFHAKGMVSFFVDPGRYGIYQFFGLKNEGGKGFLYYINEDGIAGAWKYMKEQPKLLFILLLLFTVFNILRLLTFIFFLFNRSVHPGYRTILALLVLTFAFVCSPVGTAASCLSVALLITGAAVWQVGYWLEMRS